MRLLLASFLALGSHGWAEIKLPELISDHMVLQQGMRITIWGTGSPGEGISVAFGSQQVADTAGADGRWRVYLDPMQAGGPWQMTISGQNKIILRDVMVGEVWVCSGQSNMAWTVAQSANAVEEISNANYPFIRMFTVEQAVSTKPQVNVIGKWELTTPETAKSFSAVGYFFGRDLHESLQVPIGLIHASVGGSPAEAWTTEATLRNDLSLQPILWQWERTLAHYPSALELYERQMKTWEGTTPYLRVKPEKPVGPGDRSTPSGLFNAMIAPLTSYSLRGVIWYQGEANAFPYRSFEYRRLFQAMIMDWRRVWDQGAFPFLFVQLPNLGDLEKEPSESVMAELREAQLMALSLPNTGMAITIDVGEATDGHPKNKQEVGRRLARAARGVAYGKSEVSSGPIYKGMTIEGNRIRIRFDQVGQGLISRGSSELIGFAIAGREHKFVWADARIEEGTVVVYSSQIPNPVAVRYAWAGNPTCNLYNKDGLPASPFRTDDWPMLSVSQKEEVLTLER